MELYQIIYFRTLCMHKHFARAAEALHITPPTLTTAIKNLEKAADFQLIDRNKKPFHLTPAGEMLLESSTRILDELDSLQSRLDTLSTNIKVIRLDVEHAFCSKRFIDTVRMFSAKCPNVEVRVMRRIGESVKSLVLDNTMSLGIVIKQPQQNDQLEYTDYKPKEYGLFFPVGHKLSGYERILPSMLKNSSLEILNLAGDIVRPLQDYFAPYGVKLHKGVITNIYNESVKRFIGNNLGMAILPMDMDEARNNVLARPFDPPLIIDHVFVRNKAEPHTRQMRTLMDFLISSC